MDRVDFVGGVHNKTVEISSLFFVMVTGHLLFLNYRKISKSILLLLRRQGSVTDIRLLANSATPTESVHLLDGVPSQKVLRLGPNPSSPDSGTFVPSVFLTLPKQAKEKAPVSLALFHFAALRFTSLPNYIGYILWLN